MTPAIQLLRRAGVPHVVHRYTHDPSADAWGEEAADRLGLGYHQVFKTLVVGLDDGRFAVAVVPVSGRLNTRDMAAALATKKVVMAPVAEVERVTGYVRGGVSPLGQRRRLPTVIEVSAREQATVYVSGGRRGLQVELGPADLCRLVDGRFAAIVGES